MFSFAGKSDPKIAKFGQKKIIGKFSVEKVNILGGGGGTAFAPSI
jgi:hypothetical protein